MTRKHSPKITATGAQLPARLKEVAEMVAADMSNKDIATALGVGYKTVGNYISEIYEYYGIDSRDRQDLVQAIREES